jgi:hypothetical protein
MCRECNVFSTAGRVRSSRVPNGLGLELISECAEEDEDHPELEEGEVVLGFSVAACRDPAAGF